MRTSTRVQPIRDRRQLLRRGYWQTSRGQLVALRDLNDYHLVNALLKVLSEGEQAPELAAEVRRRGLEGLATSIAAERSQR